MAAWLHAHPYRKSFDKAWKLSTNGAKVTELAGQYWRKLLWDVHARMTKNDALQQYRVVQLRELDKLLPTEYSKHPMHAGTIEARDIDELSNLIHSKSATETQQDLPALCDVRLAFYLTRSAILVNIIGRYNICFMQVMVDLVAAVFSHQGIMQDPKQRLNFFLHTFHSSLMTSCPLPSGLQSIKQLQDIPSDFTVALADRTLHELARGPLYDAVATLAGDKQVFVDIPLTSEALSTTAVSEFLQGLMQFAGIGRLGPAGHFAPTMYHCGSVHWSYFPMEDTLMYIDC